MRDSLTLAPSHSAVQVPEWAPQTKGTARQNQNPDKGSVNEGPES